VQDLGLEWHRNEKGIWLQLHEPERAMPDLLRKLLNDGLDVYECRLVPATLEDLFVDVVTRA
jgi:hypothetical protein